jgi:KipI family sensor histidine kinase inhibitor
MVQFDTTRTSYRQIAQWISRTRTSLDDEPDTAATVTVPVRYDGADLAEVAEMRNLTPEQVVALHCEPVYTVAFCGFAPGFAYLVGSPAALHVPRRTSPRTEVPAGSVALAGEFTGIYPTASPGGWQLIGITDLPLFDIDRDPPSLLAPGTRVRFVEAQ